MEGLHEMSDILATAEYRMSQQQAHVSEAPDVKDEVRDFYDHYPYPRPVDSLEKYQRRWQDEQRCRADYHLFWPASPYQENRSILVAGCGTSQAAKHAMRWPHAKVTGIDVSSTSVHCTEELKRKHNLNNLQVHQLAIEQVSELETRFDQIVCTGVLHHLADPDAGLRALRGVLKPEGAMHLMVYAPYGRAGIYLLQEFCQRIGLSANDAAIRDLVVALRALPPGHPLETLLRDAPDFRQEAATADALLHPQDRAYSVPQLLEFIENGGLRFGRWIKQAPYSLRCGVMASIPQVTRMAHLPLSEQYAAIELFRGTMTRHSLVVYRNDNSIPSQQVSFAGDAWRGYVPIRMPDTICVQERLPLNVAAVLINQTHTYRDLFLPINAAEKNLFDAIDGKRSVGELVEQSLHTERQEFQLAQVRAFLEQLWWYDQVVFDASRAHA
jgi:2-polyprenyl-3-methyl-5-hydroxy-6-metoxy-1,4-benzoquinol methylase